MMSAERGGRLFDQIGGLPARDHPARVEVRLVADDAAGDASDPEGPHAAGKRLEIGAGERGVAESLQHELAMPRRALELSVAEHVRLDPEVGAEVVECRKGEGELFGRGWQEAALLVEREDLAACAEVDRDGAGLVALDVWDGQSLREARLEGRSGLGGPGGQERGCEGDYRPGAWACPPPKMGRPAHAPRHIGIHNRLRPLPGLFNDGRESHHRRDRGSAR